MLFQTYQFLILLLSVMVGIHLLRRARSQHYLLLLASYIFYGWWDVRFLMLILLSSLVDYSAALGVAGIRLSVKRRLMLSGQVFAGMGAFLLVDWPALQGPGAEWGEVFLPQWDGLSSSLIACVALVVLGNLYYVFVFGLSDRGRRKGFLLASLMANLGMLGFFKYYNFFTDNLTGIGSWLGYTWDLGTMRILLPVGISFYTFQTLSYTIDVYRGKVEPERSFVRTALYVAYFPQLVAGPILRPNHFLPTLGKPWVLKADNLQRGFHLICVGMVKKVLIADWVGPLVDKIFEAPVGYSSVVIILGCLLFMTQLYCDFSGYSDIARGVSRIFGVEIPLNFNYPLFSTSITKFWNRWHISLSSWLRDYLFLSLPGSKGRSYRVYRNLFITMVVCGIWHGAGWGFVLFGCYHGLLVTINRLWRGRVRKSPSLKVLLKRRRLKFVCFLIQFYLSCVGLFFFRVDPQYVWYCLKKFILVDFKLEFAGLGLGEGYPIISLLACLAFMIAHPWSYFRGHWDEWLNTLSPGKLRLVYFTLGLAFILFWPTAKQPFFYFQF